jgi:glycosyltransferase involved in cell wall biosynthesis
MTRFYQIHKIKFRKNIFEHPPWENQSMRFIDYVFLKNINKLLLRLKALPKYDQEDITVVIAVRDRFDYRIINAFKSIRNQDYPHDLIKLVLVDYGSKKELIPSYEKLCKEYDAEYIRIDNRSIWCKSHALNIVIKQAKTKYILSTDADIMFENNYIKEAVKELQRNPYQVILSKCLDVPKTAIKDYDFYELKKIATFRFKGSYLSSGINIALTYFYHRIRGYDERYVLWGGEDDDLIKRFKLLGLKSTNMSKQISYVHLWHPKYQGAKNYQQIETNEKYLRNNHSIFRNKDGWGEIN